LVNWGEAFFSMFWRIIILMLFFVELVTAQQYLSDFNQISTEQGLPGENISSISQDKNGIIWFCIEGAGICKYDGTNFYHFKRKDSIYNSISDNNAYMNVVDKLNRIWIATDFGLNVYTQETDSFKVYFHTDDDDENDLPDSQVYTITIAEDSTIWIGTRNGLCRYNEKEDNFTRYLFAHPRSGFTRNVIYKILESKDNTFWLGTSEGLVHFDPVTSDTVKYDKGLTHLQVRNLIEDKDGNVWIATARGLNFFDKKKKEIIPWKFKNSASNFLAADGVHMFMFDQDSALWIGTYSQGAVIISPDYKSDRLFREDPSSLSGLKSRNISYIFQDADKGMWIGTKYDGVGYYDRNKDVTILSPPKYDIFNSVQNKYITSFRNEGDSIYYVGTKFDGLYIIKMNQNTIENVVPIIGEDKKTQVRRIQSVYRDINNIIWVGSDMGLVKYDPVTGQSKLILSAFINQIYEDFGGRIWVATFNRAYHLDINNDRLTVFKSGHNFFDNTLLDLIRVLEDSDGNIWFGSRYNGAFMYNENNGVMHHFTYDANDEKSISNDLIRFIYEDINGQIWIGTRGYGLNKFHKKNLSFSHFQIEDGLPSNFLLSVVECHNGFLWFGTHDGLSRFNPMTNEFLNFFKNHGLRNNIYEINAYGKLENKYLIFGGSKGLNIISPDNMRKNTSVSKLLIKSVYSGDDYYYRNVTEDKDVTITYGENNLSFEFVTIDYNTSTNNLYRCKMVGMDDHWIDLENGNSISYRNLPPGEYVFQVQGCNSFGNWNMSAPKISIKVLPPFYSTWKFRLLVILFATLLLISIYRLRLKSIKDKNNVLSDLVKERTISLEQLNMELLEKNKQINEQKELIEKSNEHLEHEVIERTKDLESSRIKAEESDRLKSAFLANMSHEIRTPLNAIVGFSSLLDDDELTVDERNDFVKIINSNTESLLSIIDDLLDISSIEAGQLKIIKNNFLVKEMLEELYSNFKNILKHKNQHVDLFLVNKIPDDLILYSDINRIKQIISNLLSNAIKYTHKGSIIIGVNIVDDKLLFFVKDTGLGIPLKYRKSIFDRFIKIEDRSRFYQGNGLGLSICKSLVELLGGEIWLESVENMGSDFYFYVPVE